MAYRVGQILFVILNKKMQVYPMMVVEEITKRTMQGEQTSYVLQGGSDSSSTILLDKVDGEIFESADEAKYVLTSRATSQIESLVDTAVEKAEQWYSEKDKNDIQQVNESTLEEQKENIEVQLPDGTIAKLKNFGMVG